jgi:hypothetical protein
MRERNAMSKAVDEILNSILEDFKACRQAKEELEAKALFRLLNYCPPNPASEPLLEKPADPN